MNKTIELLEYEYLTDNDLCNEPGYYVVDSSSFNQLEELLISAEESDFSLFFQLVSKRYVGKVIQAKNYVGMIELSNGLKLQILPKLPLDFEEESNKLTKQIFMKMIRSLMSNTGRVSSITNLQSHRMNIYEIYIFYYLEELSELVRRGLRSSYIKEEGNLMYLKGKLDLARNIKVNQFRKNQFYVHYSEFNIDRAENKIIKTALIKLSRISKNNENQKKIKQLLIHFDEVNISVNVDNDLKKISLDRNIEHYRSVLEWSVIILKNKSFSSFSGEVSTRAMMFPMEMLFESYVAKQVKHIFSPKGYLVKQQVRGNFLFEFPRRFQLRPDILIQKNNRIIIMDTKWKALNNVSSSNFGVSQADMYQMFAYANIFNSSDVFLLYPKTKEINKESIQYETTVDKKVISVHIYFVDVSEIVDSITNLYKYIERRMNNELSYDRTVG